MFGDLVALVLGYFGHRLAFWKILPDQPVGVLVGPALPAVMRGGEVELDRTQRFHLAIPVELRPVVRRDRAHPPRMTRQQVQQRAVGGGRGACGKFSQQEVAALALDQGENTVAALSRALAHHGIDLPVAELAPPLHTRGPLSNHSFSRQSPSAVVSPVAFPAALARTAQMFVQRASTSQILPDVPVDGLVADRQFAFQAQVPGDLFRAPLLPQQLFHSLPLLGSKLAVAPRVSPSRLGSLLRLIRSIPAIVPRPVAPQLPPHCAPVSSQFPGDLRRVQTHHSQRRQYAPLSPIELPILHPYLRAGFLPFPNPSFSLPSTRRPCCT